MAAGENRGIAVGFDPEFESFTFDADGVSRASSRRWSSRSSARSSPSGAATSTRSTEPHSHEE